MSTIHRRGVLLDGIGKELVRSANGGPRKTLSQWLATLQNSIELEDLAEAFTSGDATPDVSGSAKWITSGSTAITDFDGATEGQVIHIYRGDADIVITRNASLIETLDAANITLTATHPMVSFRSVSGVWREIERSNSVITATGSTTARTLANRFAEVFNVKDYGATGDGTTNDTTAITAAITAAGTGGAVYFPEGVYIFSTVLTQLSGQRWFGDGRAASILRLAASVTSIAVCVTASDFAEDYTIEDLQIDGNRGNITPATDLYNTFFLVRGPRGGRGGTYRNLLLNNSWGRVLQTSNEAVSEYATDILVENVRVENAGTKAISATRSKRVTIANCFVEVDPYTSADHAGGVGDGNATSGSCFECNESIDVVITGNHGIQIGSVEAPGIRLVNECSSIRVFGNTIDGASHLGFIQNANDVDFYGNIGRGLTGNGILVADADAEAGFCRRVRIHHNTIIDPDDAFVFVTANNSAHVPEVEVYIYENDFVQSAGTPLYGIYNEGVSSPAVSGTCLVNQWDNTFTGTIPTRLAGPAAHKIGSEPGGRLELIEQSAVASATHTGTTAETTIRTVTVPGNRMGENGYILLEPDWTFSGAGGNRITRERLGGTQAAAVTNASSVLQQSKLLKIRNRNSLSSQLVSISGLAAGVGSTASARATLSKDTSGDLNVTFTVELANSGDTAVLDGYSVWVFHAL